ncbi:MAG: TIGR04086 family membrane protein [Eubacterium sp.]|nr:TIGR04086 family membrane protein [Eubacterium sp.]
MKKYSTSSTERLLIKYVLKVVLTSLITILLFTYFFSQTVYKLDLDLESNSIFSVFIVLICSSLTAYISVLSIKNNGALMGVIAQIPLIFYSVINLIFNDNSFILFLIKLAISLFCGALFGILASKKSSKFKVK